MAKREDQAQYEKPVIEVLEEKVNELYNFRDRYFETHSLDEACKRTEDVAELLDQLISIFSVFEEKALAEDRAVYYYLLGKAHNVHENYSEKAEEVLKKAVKLNPNIVDAWNHLGECFFKKNDISEAKNCFENALSKKRNAHSLRCLSTISRQENSQSKTAEECQKRLKEGLELAEEAAKLEPNDGMAWAALGNAYLFKYFNSFQQTNFLDNALLAFKKAVSHRENEE